MGLGSDDFLHVCSPTESENSIENEQIALLHDHSRHCQKSDLRFETNTLQSKQISKKRDYLQKLELEKKGQNVKTKRKGENKIALCINHD